MQDPQKKKSHALLILAIVLGVLVYIAVMLAALVFAGVIDLPSSGRRAAAGRADASGARIEEQAEPIDAEAYFEENGTIVDVTEVDQAENIPSEREVSDTLTERGFAEAPVTTEYDMDGTYQGSTEVTDGSRQKHPVYQTMYEAANGDVWVIDVIENSVTANPLSYNMASNSGVPVLVSESETLLSYDSASNSYYETVPDPAAVTLVIIEHIDGAALDALSQGELAVPQ